MSNRALWDIRKRHVWLATPRKGKKMKLRERLRCGLERALQYKAAKQGTSAAAEMSEES